MSGLGYAVNLEAFLANVARERNVYVVGFFDSCRRKQIGEEVMAFNPALHSSENIAVIYREQATEQEPGTCSCD